MTNFAYLRVSKDTQDVENQKFGILDYCNQKKIAPVTIVEDTESRSKSWRDLGIGQNELKDKFHDWYPGMVQTGSELQKAA